MILSQPSWRTRPRRASLLASPQRPAPPVLGFFRAFVYRSPVHFHMTRNVSRAHPFRAALLCIAIVIGAPRAVLAHATGEDYIFVNFRDDGIDGEGRDSLQRPREQTRAEARWRRRCARVSACDRPARHRVHQAPFFDPARRRRRLRAGVHHAGSPRAPAGSIRAVPTSVLARVCCPTICESITRCCTRATTASIAGSSSSSTMRRTNIDYGPEYVAMVFGPVTTDQPLNLASIPSMLVPRDMVWQGVLHIWMGIDHVLFLIALMLPTVLVLKGDSWRPGGRFSESPLEPAQDRHCLHDRSFDDAAARRARHPRRAVASRGIGDRLVDHPRGAEQHHRKGSGWFAARDPWPGLVPRPGIRDGHGTPAVPHRVPASGSVLGFNIGVELGQMAIVAVLFPALFLLRKLPLYMPVVLRGGSLVLILISGVWFVQRAFGLG